VLRRAKALHAVFSELPIFVRDGERIVGQRSAVLGGRSVYPEYHLDGLDEQTTPPDIWEYWHGRTLGDQFRLRRPEPLRIAEREMASGWCTGSASGFGHVIVDYEKAITVGFDGIIARARQLLATSGEDDEEGRAFLQAVIISCEGMLLWAGRYADLAESLARDEGEAERAAELREIAATCRRVPGRPARTFREALQSFWFVHLAMHIEQFGWSISAGRFDQYVYPFFRDDIEASRITRDGAWELLLGLWVKFMENVGTKIGRTTFQNLTLGGQMADGTDASNELSHVCLDATVALNVHQPALSVRWHRNVDPRFWDHVQRTLACGLGMPALFNDEVIVEALVRHGVDERDALSYGIVGCVEASVPGKMQGVTSGGHLNMAKALELALNDGRSMITGDRIGPSTGAPESWSGFDDLWAAYAEQVEYLCGLDVLATHIAGEGQKQWVHCPLMSCLLDDCLERRRDLVYGGTRYKLPGVGIFGSSNVADGMMAIKRLVCDEKRIGWGELRGALLDDFEGHERVRIMLATAAPRFGNDERDVDELANRINAIHASIFWRHVDSRGGRYTCGIWPVEGHIGAGQHTAATPDGRRKRSPLVDGVGACQGADLKGPTALLNSVARLNNVEHWPSGNTCNIKFSASSIRGEGGIERLNALTTTFMRLGGQELQINVVDRETLRAAQADPDAYRGLMVRVAGFSAYFTMLARRTQDEIIARTEHAG
jgi:formate C-acetyltransferase